MTIDNYGNEAIEELEEYEHSMDNIKQLWPELEPNQMALISRHMVVKRFKKNTDIYTQYSIPHYLLIVMEGKVKVFKDGFGRNQIIRVVKPIEMFGVRAYFAGEEHSSTATTLEDSVIAFIPVNVMMKIITSNPHVALSIIRHLAVQLGHSDNRTVNLTQKHIRGRLAEALLFLKENHGLEEDGLTLKIYMSREDLANLSNMTTANAIRTLSAFAEEKLIAIDGKKIKILQEEELIKTSRMG